MMNINDLTNNVDKNKLNDMLKQFGQTMSKEELNKVTSAINGTNSAQLKRQLSQINPKDINNFLNSNPNLKKALSSNSDAMKTLNSLLSGGK